MTGTEAKLIVKVPPRWMKDEAYSGLGMTKGDYAATWIAAARFAATKGFDTDEALAIIMQAYEIRRARTLAQWRHEVAVLVSSPLRRGGRTRGSNYDRPVIAFFLQHAMTRLLELSKAPARFGGELDEFLKSSLPRDAQMRAKLQAILIRRPQLTAAALAQKAKCSEALAYRYLRDGTIRRPC